MTVSGPGTTLPPIEIVARNTAITSDNKIHDDAEARRYGYGGGLVPGVTLYAYLTRLALQQYGAAWIERGTATCAFRRPVYEGETVRCEGTVTDLGAAEPSLDVRVLRNELLCAGGTFGMATGAIAMRRPDAPPEPPSPLPELRPDSVPLGIALAPLRTPVTADTAIAYAEMTDDPTPWYRDGSPFGGPLLPPGWLAARQAVLLRHNFHFGPSIHARSVIRHLAPAFARGTYESHGTIRETYERNGNHYLILDAVTLDGDGSPVCTIEHHTIYRVREADASDED